MYQISNITNEFNTHEQPTGSDTKPSLAVVLSHCVPSPPLLVSISPLLPIALSLQISHFQILSPGFSKREFLQRSTFAPDVASFRGEELGDHGAENHDEEEPNSNMWSAEDPIKSARKYIGRGFFFQIISAKSHLDTHEINRYPIRLECVLFSSTSFMMTIWPRTEPSLPLAAEMPWQVQR